MSSSLDLSALTALAHLARERNFTSVARKMGITPSAVSKAIARLEQEMGAKLVARNSRSMALTPEGLIFYARCHELLVAVEEAKRALSDQHTQPSGRLRVSLPEGFGRVVIAPRLSEFATRHPQIELEVLFTEDRLEFIESNMDVAVWTGALSDSRLIARALQPLMHVTCASPAYLAAHGVPRTVDDLTGHTRLGAIARRTGQLQTWRFLVDGAVVEHPCKPRVRSDSVHALVDLAIDGFGIAQVTDYSAADAISKGLLAPILTEYSGLSTQLNLVYPSNARKLGRVKAFADFITMVAAERLQVNMRARANREPPARIDANGGCSMAN